jgi:two-component system response regulator FlrC
MESEMFGHEKGAFTGAQEQKQGRFEIADQGTLFLDEIGELPLELQAKLLRVIQEQKFERVGGINTITVDVRIIAATNINLEKAVADRTFREDLFHRLQVFPINLPPLNERQEDIIPIAALQLEQIAARMGVDSLELDNDARNQLLNYNWPGNVRELGNALERAAILCDPPVIKSSDLLFLKAGSPVDGTGGVSLKQLEKEAIEKALLQTDGHRKKAAELLGIGLRTLYNKLKAHGI